MFSCALIRRKRDRDFKGSEEKRMRKNKAGSEVETVAADAVDQTGEFGVVWTSSLSFLRDRCMKKIQLLYLSIFYSIKVSACKENHEDGKNITKISSKYHLPMGSDGERACPFGASC